MPLDDFTPDFLGARRVRPVLQSEFSECTYACLAMVAGFHGHHVELNGLRQRFGARGQGSHFWNLAEQAKALGLQPRGLRIEELSDLRSLALPAVLHWSGDHTVVLTHVRRRSVRIVDPASGPRRVSMAEVNRRFTGAAMEFAPTAALRTKPAAAPTRIRSLVGRVMGLRRSLAQLLVLALFVEMCVLGLPLLMQYVIDQVVVDQNADLLGVMALGITAVVFVQATAQLMRGWVSVVMATRLHMQWQSNAFDHLLRLPVEFFERRSLGDVVSRFGSIRTLQQALTANAVEIVLDGLLATLILVMMALYSTAMAASVVAAAVTYALLRAGLQRAQRDATAEQLAHSARAQTSFLETVRGIVTVRLFSGETQRAGVWANAFALETNAGVRLERLRLLGGMAMMMLDGVLRGGIIWLAASLVIRAQFTLGMLFAFLALQQQFFSRTSALADKLLHLRTMRVHAQRVAEIVHHPVEDLDGSAGRTSAALMRDALLAAPAGLERGTIELRDVWFRYSDDDPWILKGVSLSVRAGESVAITGASGCGKSTLLKIVLGLVRPTRGQVLCDGVDITEEGLSAWRARVGCVMQDDALFSGSIESNVAFAAERIDAQALVAACRAACIESDIAQLPMRYQTMVGDLGSMLSGGQRQRLCLARALYKQPAVLVLDEATSHLDAEAERRINANIAAMGVTRVVVAHRAETIASAARVVRLAAGVVASDVVQASNDPQVLTVPAAHAHAQAQARAHASPAQGAAPAAGAEPAAPALTPAAAVPLDPLRMLRLAALRPGVVPPPAPLAPTQACLRTG